MKRSIHKRGESPFLLAVAAALFLAASCYVGAALYDWLPAALPAAAPAAAESGGRLRGIAIRNEQTVSALNAPDGKRLTGQGVYLASCDGYESLAPERLDGLTAQALEKLFDTPPGEPGEARIVQSAVWYYAALLPEGEAPEPGRCRLRFAGFARAVPARLIETREDGLLLFRLNEGGEYLNIRVIEAEIERG